MKYSSILELEKALLSAKGALTKAEEALIALSTVDYGGKPAKREANRGNGVTLAAMEQSYRTWTEAYKTKKNAEVSFSKAERALISAKRAAKVHFKA